jgi:hypothetical protein
VTDEIPLGGGWSVDGVVRVGDTVRKPPAFATQLMRDVLAHLEQVDFDAAPRWLGLDEDGRDVLSFIEGDTAHGWSATLVELAAERAWLAANRAAF